MKFAPALLLCTLLWALPAAAQVTKPDSPSLSADQLARVTAGEVVVWAVKDPDKPDVATATGVVEIEAPQQEIFDILASEEHSEAASKAMRNCTVHKDERVAADHRQMIVTYLMKVGPTEIEWTVGRDLYEKLGLLVFEIDDSYDNGIEWTQGYYGFYPGSDANHVMIVYVSNLNTGRRIPTWLEEDLTQGSLKRYLGYLQTAAEAD
jgi:hypothetical protein